MVGFLKKLFGGNDNQASKAEQAEAQEYEGFKIIPTPMKENGQYRLCGLIQKEIDGELKEHKFIRADLMSSIDDAVEIAYLKGRQVVDQQGDRMFS